MPVLETTGEGVETMTKNEYEMLLTRLNDMCEHWQPGIDLKFSTGVKTGMRMVIREIRRIYEGEENADSL